MRLMMHGIPRYGHGGSRADEWAQKIAQTFAATVKAKPTAAGHNMIPGQYSWLGNRDAGQGLGATPNGRRANAPISHGASPDPGFRHDGAPTALSHAITSVELGWGNTVTITSNLQPLIYTALLKASNSNSSDAYAAGTRTRNPWYISVPPSSTRVCPLVS